MTSLRSVGDGGDRWHPPSNLAKRTKHVYNNPTEKDSAGEKNDAYALDAVDWNPRPRTPPAAALFPSSSFQPPKQMDRQSPRGVASAFHVLSSRSHSSPASFRAEEDATITETNHFSISSSSSSRPVATARPVARHADPAAITETNHFLEHLLAFPEPRKRLPASVGGDGRKNGGGRLVRALQAELRAEREARRSLEEEVARLRKLLREGEKTRDRVDNRLLEERDDADRVVRKRAADVPPVSPPASSSPPPVAATPTSTFHSVPIVDLSKPLADVSFEVGRACREVGFFYVAGHGVDPSLVSEVLEASRRFFDLPTAAKSLVDASSSRSGARGYFALGGESLDAKDGTRDLMAEGQALGGGGDDANGGGDAKAFRGDWKEGYDCGREISPPSKDDDYGGKGVPSSPLIDLNLWPAEESIPGFRDTLLRYQSAALGVAERLAETFAVGLGLPPRHFASRTREPMCTLRLLHYPPQPPSTDVDEVDKIGCGAHTDYGLCTLLLQDDTGGLQVRNADDVWIDAPPVPGTFVVNVGDMMSRWTNGRYASTVHRVVNLSGRERYSVPFFFNPDVGTLVECLPTCVNENEGPRWEAKMSHEILEERYEGTFAHAKKERLYT